MPDSQFSKSLDAAVGYFELGMIEDALLELRRLPKEFRDEPEVLELQSAIGVQTCNWELAATALATICRQPCACVDQFIEWGCHLYELGKIAECRSALLDAPGAREQHGLWHYHLACYESLLGNFDEARRLIQRALALEPRLRRMAEANENLCSFL